MGEVRRVDLERVANGRLTRWDMLWWLMMEMMMAMLWMMMVISRSFESIDVTNLLIATWK